MMLWSGPLLPLVSLAWPLFLALLAALPGVRALRLLPLAPLPALVLALVGTSGETVAPVLLLGLHLTLDESTRLLLGMSSALWLMAGIYAQSMAGGRNPAIFAGFWCLTLAGNTGVFLAADVITFYACFAAVSLSSWFLIIHDRSPEAHHAGRVYIVLALLGEVCLLAGFLIGAQAADSFLIADIRRALAEAPFGSVGVGLLVVGFGIKAGMVPLHFWLPLAHPAAPVAASAVLSGAIVKAGLAGFLLFLPPGAFGTVLVVPGLVGAFGAALWGLTQSNPKTMLAYSTISQMGLMLTLIGGDAAPLVVAFYAVHHGLAKGALFLSVGAVRTSRGAWRVLLLGGAAVAALSIAGLPLSGGAAVKLVSKTGLSDGLMLAITLSSVTTAVLLAVFSGRLARLPRGSTAGAASVLAQRLPVMALSFGAAFGPWLLWPDTLGLALEYALTRSALLDAAWPLALGLAFSAILLAARIASFPGLRQAEMRGDVSGIRLPSGWRNLFIRPAFTAPAVNLTWCEEAAEALERTLKRWRFSGLASAVILVALFLLMR